MFKVLSFVGATSLAIMGSPARACDEGINVGRSVVAMCLGEGDEGGKLCVNHASRCLEGEVAEGIIYFDYRVKAGDLLIYEAKGAGNAPRLFAVPGAERNEAKELLLVLVGGILTMLGGIFSGWAIAISNEMRSQSLLVRDWRDRQAKQLKRYGAREVPNIAVDVPYGLSARNFSRIQRAHERIAHYGQSVDLTEIEEAEAITLSNEVLRGIK